MHSQTSHVKQSHDSTMFGTYQMEELANLKKYRGYCCAENANMTIDVLSRYTLFTCHAPISIKRHLHNHRYASPITYR